MSERSTILLFDYGGVLANHHQDPAEAELSVVLRVDRQRVRQLLSEKSPQGKAVRCAQISEEQFWCKVFELAEVDRENAPADHDLTRLWAQTYSPSVEMFQFVDRVRRQGVLAGIVTNIDKGRSTYLLEELRIDRQFDFYFPSYRFGCVKADSQLWARIDSELKKTHPHSEILYVDDRPEHIESAHINAGWRGVLFTGSTECIIELEKVINDK